MKESSPDDAAVTLAFAPEGHHRPRLRHGRRPGAAQGLGAGQAARRPRHPGQVRHPPGRRPHARAHERAARRGRRALRHDLRPGRDQRRVPDRRRRHRHRRQRRREPRRPRRPRQPHLRHADPGRGQGASRRSSSSAAAAPGSPASRTSCSTRTTRAWCTATRRTWPASSSPASRRSERRPTREAGAGRRRPADRGAGDGASGPGGDAGDRNCQRVRRE